MRYTNIINNHQPTLLNNQLYYKTHTLFDTITHARNTNIIAIPSFKNQKTSLQPVPLGPPITENSADGTEELLLKTQVSEDFT